MTKFIWMAGLVAAVIGFAYIVNLPIIFTIPLILIVILFVSARQARRNQEEFMRRL